MARTACRGRAVTRPTAGVPGRCHSAPTIARVLVVLTVLLFPTVASAQEAVEYYGTDALGAIRVVLDQSGGVVGRSDYMPFGEEVFAPGPMPRQRFTGQERDGDAA